MRVLSKLSFIIDGNQISILVIKKLYAYKLKKMYINVFFIIKYSKIIEKYWGKKEKKKNFFLENLLDP